MNDINQNGLSGQALPERDVLAAFMREAAYKPLTLEELMEIFEIPENRGSEMEELLDTMESSGLVVRTRTDRYGAPERMDLMVGRLQAHAKGFGFVMPDYDSAGGDLFVSAENLNGAMHNDRVVARILTGGARSRGRRREGEIIRVLKRANQRIVGKLERTRRYGFVTPADQRLSPDIFVPRSELNGARSGEMVVIEVTRWPEPRRSPEGRVVERLGRPEDRGVDVEVIMFMYGLDPEFPAEVELEIRDVPDHVQPEELAGRRDLRNLTMVTVDGADAKDLDDALSLESLANEKGRARWRVGVHIADVTHYVREGSALDNEARHRATSVYLVDRVVPMLPMRLSNGICSLNPQVDRLALTVFMDLDDQGRVISHEVTPSVIHIDERLTYDDVFAMLEPQTVPAAGVNGQKPGQDPEARRQRYRAVLPMLQDMDRIARLRFQGRLDRGCIDFDFPEAKIILDADGRPRDIKTGRRNRATQLIEEFMIMCNETVAESFKKQKIPFLYRVHEPPAEDAVETFEDFIRLWGYRLRSERRSIEPADFQNVLGKLEGRPEQYLVSTVVLRTMQRARYTHENLGHFGLAAEYYTHFTSPIRRYPDLIIHRIIKESLQGRLSPHRTAQLLKLLPDLAADCSSRERQADEAERESVDLKKAEFMEQFVGDVFEGIISGVTQFGLFVQLGNTVEGLVHVSTMTDDYYHFDDAQFTLAGERTGRRFRLGDPLKVQLTRVDLAKRSVDFRIMSDEDKKEPIVKKQAVKAKGRPAGRRKRGGRGGRKAKSKGAPS
ncbi:MAG: ribonuclease R [Thermaerobacterales bacterium]